MKSTLSALAAAAILAGCAGSSSGPASPAPAAATPKMTVNKPTPDPRVGLKAGLWDAGEAAWNMRLVSNTRPSEKFLNSTNSDLAFTGHYAIQGNYNGFQVWDISNPASPTLAASYYCPASQSDVSVYKSLLFVSAEGRASRADCGDTGVQGPVSQERILGIRIFDISDIRNPKYVGNVQTCRGSHTHSVLADPRDPEHVYVYVSGSAGVRSEQELPGCANTLPEKDKGSALFRIEVIKVPLADPSKAAIVSSPRIFDDLKEAPEHGPTEADKLAMAEAKKQGAFVVDVGGNEFMLPPNFTRPMLDSVVKARGGTGTPTSADSAALRAALPDMVKKWMGAGAGPDLRGRGPTQCHDITLYPAIGYAGGACEGYGLLLDIKNPAQPVRVDAVADSNFSYWHSATFNNDGTKILFSDEWGGGGAPKCRATDPMQWGADAIFELKNGKMQFASYYKMPAAQTDKENCVAHNGSLIPIPGRDVMVQAWYQGGISVFDWTDARNPVEIAYHDRGPVDATRMGNGGSWSVYWYNGAIVSSEIARGLDIFELTPSPYLTQNEIDASKTVKLEYYNVQGQPKFSWPNSFALARAYIDQLERAGAITSPRAGTIRTQLAAGETVGGAEREKALGALSRDLDREANGSKSPAKVRQLATTVKALSTS
jgi:hypothetical protein